MLPPVEPEPSESEPPRAPWSMPADITPAPALEPEYHAAWSEPSTRDDSGAREEAIRTIAALEQWLDAIHVARAHRSP